MNIAVEDRIERTAPPSRLELSMEPLPAVAPGTRGRWIAGIALVGTLAIGAAAWRYFAAPAPPAYGVTQVRRGDIRQTISATGKVQAVTTVQVGTQVSGTVAELYADFNDHVKAGQIIARLDPSQIEAQLKQSRASLAASEANVASARNAVSSQQAAVAASKANVDRVDAVVLEANRAYENTANLVKEGVAPARQLETQEATRLQSLAQKAQAEAQYAQAKSQAESAKSQLDQAQAQASQARAAVEVATVNLSRTVIRAPIDGVVVSRNVDVGQTVAASLQAPVLFLIANDLTKMQVLADIDEADVGQLSPQSKATFTVDAFPRETFSGRISQVRLSPAVVQNVVTYTAVIDVDNPKLQLKPGMTATITATVAEAKDVLMIPSAALRFRPSEEKAAAAVPIRGGRLAGSLIWKVDGGELEPVRAHLGMSDGLFTELRDSSLAEGDQIAIAATPQGDSQKKPPGGGSFPGMGSQRMRRF
jgi:HlyD family secretion protein